MNAHLYIPKLSGNFNVLPQGHQIQLHDQLVKLYFHSKLEKSIVKSRLEMNVDLAFLGLYDSEKEVLGRVFGNRVINASFLDKSVQMALISNYQYKYPNEHLIVPDTYAGNRGPGKYPYGHLKGTYIVKPQHGARGLGQIKIPFNESDKGNVTNGPNRLISELRILDSETTNEDIVEILDKEFKGSVFSIKGERKKNESSRVLLEGLSEGLVFQKFVPDIESEYRLILDYHREIVYVQERDIEHSDYNGMSYSQAIGSNEVYRKDQCLARSDLICKMSESNFKYLSLMLKELVSPMSSVDLFITKDKKFGLFEWSSEFGSLGIPSEINLRLHEDFIRDWIFDTGVLYES